MYGWAPISIAAACTSLIMLSAAPVLAASLVTFVSGEGTDSGTCASPANPCRTFQFAFGQTSPGGEIKALDPDDYGPITITQSISITGVDGAGIDTPSSDDITINAGPNDTVNLSRLILDGVQTAVTGIRVEFGRIADHHELRHPEFYRRRSSDFASGHDGFLDRRCDRGR